MRDLLSRLDHQCLVRDPEPSDTFSASTQYKKKLIREFTSKEEVKAGGTQNVKHLYEHVKTGTTAQENMLNLLK